MKFADDVIEKYRNHHVDDFGNKLSCHGWQSNMSCQSDGSENKIWLLGVYTTKHMDSMDSLVTGVLSPVLVCMICHEKDAGKLKKALKRAPEQFDVWKTSLRIKWSSSVALSFEMTMLKFEEWLCLKEYSWKSELSALCYSRTVTSRGCLNPRLL